MCTDRLLVGALLGFEEAISALLASARGESVSLGLPLLSALFSAACLVVLGYGVALAPKPQTSLPPQPESASGS